MGDDGVYRSHVEADKAGLSLAIATQDKHGSGRAGPYTRVLRVKPGEPNSLDFRPDEEHIDLLAVSVEVRRDIDGELGWPPHDFGQGQAILINIAQAIELRGVLDVFVQHDREWADRRAKEIAEMVAASGDMYGRPR